MSTERIYVLAETDRAAIKIARRVRIGSIARLYVQAGEVLRAYQAQNGVMQMRYYPFEVLFDGRDVWTTLLVKRKTAHYGWPRVDTEPFDT